jgi:methyl-accepting chemotaxis protein
VAYTQQYIVQQVEKVLYLITELSSTLQNQDESLEEMEKTITVVAKLVVSLVELLP